MIINMCAAWCAKVNHLPDYKSISLNSINERNFKSFNHSIKFVWCNGIKILFNFLYVLFNHQRHIQITKNIQMYIYIKISATTSATERDSKHSKVNNTIKNMKKGKEVHIENENF